MSEILKDIGKKFNETVKFIKDKSQELGVKSNANYQADKDSHTASDVEARTALASAHTEMIDGNVALKTEDKDGWAADIEKLKNEVEENEFESVIEAVTSLNGKISAVEQALKEFDKVAEDLQRERRELVGSDKDYVFSAHDAEAHFPVYGDVEHVEAKAAMAEAKEGPAAAAEAEEGGEE